MKFDQKNGKNHPPGSDSLRNITKPFLEVPDNFFYPFEGFIDAFHRVLASGNPFLDFKMTFFEETQKWPPRAAGPVSCKG